MNATDLARLLLDTADHLGAAVIAVEAAVRDPRHPVLDEEQAADTVIQDGTDVIAALRRLAMRCDRAAYANRTDH